MLQPPYIDMLVTFGCTMSNRHMYMAYLTSDQFHFVNNLYQMWPPPDLNMCNPLLFRSSVCVCVRASINNLRRTFYFIFFFWLDDFQTLRLLINILNQKFPFPFFLYFNWFTFHFTTIIFFAYTNNNWILYVATVSHAIHYCFNWSVISHK